MPEVSWPTRKLTEYETSVRSIIVIMSVAKESGLDLSASAIEDILTTQHDRSLRSRFAIYAVTLSVAFSLLSYAVVILNSIFSWGISAIAITALIIETPLQFIGLLAIITINLFPGIPPGGSRRERIFDRVGPASPPPAPAPAPAPTTAVQSGGNPSFPVNAVAPSLGGR